MVLELLQLENVMRYILFWTGALEIKTDKALPYETCSLPK